MLCGHNVKKVEIAMFRNLKISHKKRKEKNGLVDWHDCDIKAEKTIDMDSVHIISQAPRSLHASSFITILDLAS